MKRRWLGGVCGALAILSGMPQNAWAANGADTWVGNSSANFSGSNWTGVNNPPLTGDSWVFGAAGTSGTTLNNDLAAGVSVAGITFNSGASVFTINGNNILLSGTAGITNNSSSVQTLGMQILSGNANRTYAGAGLNFTGKFLNGGSNVITVNNTGTVTYSGGIDLRDTGTATRSLTLNGSGNIVVNSVIGMGTATAASGISYTGTGTLTLSGANSYTGTTTISQGTVIVGTDSAVSTNGAFGNAANTQAITLGDTVLTGAASILTNGAFTVARNITEKAGVVTNSSLSIGGNQTSGTSTYTGSIALTKATTLTSAAGGQVDFTTGVISGAVNITIDGGGIVRLTGVNTFGNATAHANSVTIQGGTKLNLANSGTALGAAGNDLNFNNGGLQFAAVFDPTANRTLNFQSGGAIFDTNGNAITLANAVGNGGTGGLTLDDSNGTPGSLTLTAANTYTGGTTVKKGTLILSGAGTLGGTSGALIVNTGGTLDLNGTNQSVGNFTGTGGTVVNNSGSGTRTLTIGTGNGTGGNYGGVIANNTSGAGAVALTKTGTGVIALTGVNTYTGATTINGGTLTVGGASGTLGGTAVTSSGGGVLQIGTTASTVTTTLGSGSAGSVTVNSGGGLSLANAAFNSLALNTGNGSTGLTLNDGGFLAFDVGASSSDQITFGTGVGVFASGTITVNLSLLSNLTGGTVTLISGDFTTSGSANFALGTTTNTGFLNGYTLSLRETAAGLLLDMSSTSSAYWKGGTSGSWATIGNFTTDQTGTTARSAALDSSTNVIFNADSAANSAATTLDGNRTISGLVFNTGGVGITTGTGANTLTIATGAGITVNGGVGVATNTISAAVALGSTQTWTVTDATSTLAVSGNISGAGSGLSKSGAGKLVLSGVNTYTGATNVADGILNIQSNGALGGTSGVVVSSGAVLQLQGGISTTTATALTLSGTGIASGGALENVSGTNTYSGLVSLGGTTTIGSDTGMLILSNTGTITGSGLNLTLSGAGNGSVAAVIGTGAGALTKSGAGTWTLSGANTYTGGTTVSGGTLALTGAGTLGGTSGALTVNTGGLLDLGGTSQAVGNLTGTGGSVVTNGGAGTLTIGGGNATGGNYAGSLANGTGTLSLTKIGTGALTLSGANTYTGATTVSAGALNLQSNGAAAGSSTTVASGAALQLTGGITTSNAVGLTLNGTGTAGAGALENVSGANTYTGLVTLGSDATIGSTAGTLALNNTGTITGSGFGLTLTGAGNGSIAGIIGTGTGGLTKTGTGTWTLSGANTYTGATTVNAGTLTYASTTSLSSSSVINLGATTAAVGLNYTGAGGTFSTALNFSGTTGAVTLGNGGTGAVNYTGTPTFGGVGARTLFLGNATDTFGGSIGGISDSSAGVTAVTKQGLTNSTWVLTGTNTFTGTVTVSGGVLQDTSLSSLSILTMAGSGTSNLAIFQTNGTFNRAIGTTSGNAAAGGLNWGTNSGFAAVGGSLTINLVTGVTSTTTGASDQLVWSSNFAGSGANVLAFGSTTANAWVELKNEIALGSSTTSLGTNRTIYVEKGLGGDSALLSGAIVDASGAMNMGNPVFNGGQGIIKSGAGTLVLSGTNSYTGTTAVNAGTLLINGDQTAAIGATTVSAGATLGGSGIVGGVTTVVSGGFLRPGATESGTGVLTFKNNVTLAAGSTVTMQINGATTRGTDYSAINVSGGTQFGQATLGVSSLYLNISTLLADGATLQLFNGYNFDNTSTFGSVRTAFNSIIVTGLYSGSLTFNNLGDANGAFTGTINGQLFSLNNFEGLLTITGSAAVPEPAAFGALAGVLVLAGAGFARRRKAAAAV